MKRVPVYRQLESVDCGLTCIRMISAYYGRNYELSSLKQLVEMTRIGISIKDMITCCDKIGIRAINLRLSVFELGQLPKPCILYWKTGHFVVLESIVTKKSSHIYNIIDPSYGRIKLEEHEFNLDWFNSSETGLAIALEPQPDFLTINPDIKTRSNINNTLYKSSILFILKYKNRFSITLLLSAIALLSNWSIPILLQKVIDEGVMMKNLTVVWSFLVMQLLCFISYTIANSFSNIMLAKIGFKINIDLTLVYLKKLINLPIKFFDTQFSSELIQRMNDQYRIKYFLTTVLDTILFSSLNIIAFAIILIYYNLIVFFLFLIFSILILVWTRLLLKRRKYIDYSLFSVESIQDNTVYELIHGMSEIKINNAQNFKIKQWMITQDKINALSLKSIYIDHYLMSGISFLDRLKDLLITGLCAFYVIYSDMTIGTMMTISYLLGQLSSPIRQLVNLSKTVQDAKLSYDRLDQVISYPCENISSNQLSPVNIQGISLINLSFKYDGSFNTFVLRNINLDIVKGQTTAIVGASGSGKTTLIKLLLAFYVPNEGKVLLDGADLKHINADWWREQCSAVMQDGYIYSGSILENIALADEFPDMDRVIYATKIACIDAFINKLPLKYNTKIGKQGIELSGGQKQRIFIARAVYKNPEFIFFDEATSSLDANNEIEIVSNLQTFFKERTVIIVAHRLSTVKNADRIIVLDNGRIIESGTHKDLIYQQGAYYRLIKNQLELGD